MMIVKYIDDTLRVAGTFTDEDGVATEPTTVTAWVIKPDGTETSITPTDEAGTGAWSAKYDTSSSDDPGLYILCMKGAITGFDVTQKVTYHVTALS
jgi:hypothetical protein